MDRPGDAPHTMRHTTVELDVDELRAARELLRTETTSDTVNLALREVRRRAELTRAAALVLEGRLEIIEPDKLAELRQSGLAD
jgi:hypothetical protein